MALKPTRTYADDWTDDYLCWLTTLEDDVIIEDFGYERGEFTVFPESWEKLYAEGLTPAEAWRRALDAHDERRRQEEAERKANWDRIQREDAELLVCAAIANCLAGATRTEDEDGK